MERNKLQITPGSWDEYDEIFCAAKAEPIEDNGKGDFEEVPAGKYQVKIERAEWKETNTGLRLLSFGLIILSGPHKKRWIWKSSFINNVQSAKFLIKDLATIGIKLERISLLNLESLLDIELEVKVWIAPSKKEAGKEFRNVDFIKQLAESSASNDISEEMPF